MAKKFNRNDTINMMSAVCGSYIIKDDIKKYFEENYRDVEEFELEEMKRISRELTEGRKKITGSMKGDDYFKSYKQYQIDKAKKAKEAKEAKEGR